MKRMHLLKTGSTFPQMAAKMGDFEDWFLAGMNLSREDVRIVDCHKDNLPDYAEIGGAVITGSHDMVTEHRAWSENLAGWLPGLVERDIPLLGVCYGHQLLAYALGGEVGYNRAGKHFGTVEITLTPEGQRDPLIGGWGDTLHVQVCHNQSVLSLPQNAVLLAGCPRDPHQAFRVGKCAWGVQFHPEMGADAVRSYIQAFRKELTLEGQDADRLSATCRDTPFGTDILRRFVTEAQRSRE